MSLIRPVSDTKRKFFLSIDPRVQISRFGAMILHELRTRKMLGFEKIEGWEGRARRSIRVSHLACLPLSRHGQSLSEGGSGTWSHKRAGMRPKSERDDGNCCQPDHGRRG